MNPAPPSDMFEEMIWLQIAWGELARLFGEEAARRDVSVLAAIPAAARLNVILRVDGVVRGSMSGRGATLLEQVRDAVRRAALDTRFAGPLTFAELGRAAMELWMQVGTSSLARDARMDPKALVLGVDGVEVEWGTAAAYYKPSVALTRGFTSPAQMYRALCKKAREEPALLMPADDARPGGAH